MSLPQCMDHQRPFLDNPKMVSFCKKRQGHAGPPRYPPRSIERRWAMPGKEDGA